MILRALKQRVGTGTRGDREKGRHPVPALFTEGQREATREAGELAGWRWCGIINGRRAAV